MKIAITFLSLIFISLSAFGKSEVFISPTVSQNFNTIICWKDKAFLQVNIKKKFVTAESSDSVNLRSLGLKSINEISTLFYQTYDTGSALKEFNITVNDETPDSQVKIEISISSFGSSLNIAGSDVPVDHCRMILN